MSEYSSAELAMAAPAPEREWLAELSLGFARRRGKTVLVDTAHYGPLRVQKPFYPELDGTCHVYVLHPPGGLVAGDRLQLRADLSADTQALLTTPAAGKVYGTKNLVESQQQLCYFSVAEGALLEYLPQETIIFDQARAQLKTRIDLVGTGRVFVWDVVRLGRADSGEHFNEGHCHQQLELWHDKRPLFIERNRLLAGTIMQSAPWGLRNANTTATLCATLELPRQVIDECVKHLSAGRAEQSGLWGLTQKKSVFVARYLGDSVSQCREGLEYLWRQSRPYLTEKEAVSPRIWRT